MRELTELKDLILQKENITFFMAVVSFILSTGSVAISVLKSRESYTLEVIDYAYRNRNVIQFLVCISNHSERPLSIIDISVYGTTCELYPKMIYGTPQQWNFRHSAEFPVCIPPHSCQKMYLEFCGNNFDTYLLAPGIEVSFRIRSTRKLAQKSISLGHKSHYLHTRE